MSKVLVTSRTMNNRETLRRSLQQIEIITAEFIQMNKQVGTIAFASPPRIRPSAFKKCGYRRSFTTIVHRPADLVQKLAKSASRISEHPHFFARLRQVCS